MGRYCIMDALGEGSFGAYISCCISQQQHVATRQSTAVDTGTVFRAVTANDATGAEECVAIKVVSIAGKGSLRAARSVRLGPSPECIPTRPQSRWEWAFPLTLGRPQT